MKDDYYDSYYKGNTIMSDNEVETSARLGSLSGLNSTDRAKAERYLAEHSTLGGDVGKARKRYYEKMERKSDSFLWFNIICNIIVGIFVVVSFILHKDVFLSFLIWGAVQIVLTFIASAFSNDGHRFVQILIILKTAHFAYCAVIGSFLT